MQVFCTHSLLWIYRLLTILLYPALYLYFWIQNYRLQKTYSSSNHKRFKERFGFASKVRPNGSIIWLHAASIGEIVSLIPIINYLYARSAVILLTTTHPATINFIERYLADKVVHQYAPFDIIVALKRFINYWQPTVICCCESEIWPNRMFFLAQKNIPQILVNATLSDNSFKAWHKFSFISQNIFSKLDLVVAQTEALANKYIALGCGNVKVSGNLKAEVAPIIDSKLLKHYQPYIQNRVSWAFISSHLGEEAIAIAAHKILQQKFPNILTIIVPRHIERVKIIEQEIIASDLTCVCRSNSWRELSSKDILLADTIGEMGFYLGLTEIACIAGSFVAKRGHNPLEPALLKKALISGCNIASFSDIYDKFQQAEAVYFAKNAEQLASFIEILLLDKDICKARQEDAYQVALSLQGASLQTIKYLDCFLKPLIKEEI